MIKKCQNLRRFVLLKNQIVHILENIEQDKPYVILESFDCKIENNFKIFRHSVNSWEKRKSEKQNEL